MVTLDGSGPSEVRSPVLAQCQQRASGAPLRRETRDDYGLSSPAVVLWFFSTKGPTGPSPFSILGMGMVRLHSIGGDDSWETDESGYDQNNFYTASTDHRGHSAFLRVAVSTTLGAEINRLIASGAIPAYGTAQDFIRDAMYHRLVFVSRHIDDPRLRHTMKVQRRLTERRQQMEEVQALEDLVNESRESCDKAVEVGDWFLLTRVLGSIQEEIGDEVRNPYREQLQEIVSMYGGMVPEGKEDE